MGRIYLNGKEVTNPVAKFFIYLFALIIAAAVVSLVLFVVLPAVGVVTVGAIGLAILAVILAVLAIPVFIVGGSLFGVLMFPFTIISNIFGRRRRYRYYHRW
jgi:hypothetical protein